MFYLISFTLGRYQLYNCPFRVETGENITYSPFLLQSPLVSQLQLLARAYPSSSIHSMEFCAASRGPSVTSKVFRLADFLRGMRDQAGDLPFPARSPPSLLSPLPPLEGTVSLPRAKMLAKREGTMRGKAAQAGAWELGYWERRHSIAPVRPRRRERNKCGRPKWAMCSDG